MAKIGYINGLRGLAILMVVWHHWYAKSVAVHTPDLLDPLVLAGHYGVEIFFVLSGFVLYLPFRDGREFRTGRYLLRRAKRLLPLFYIALLVSAALHRENPLPYVLVLYPNPEAIGPSFNFPLWSISAEIWFSALLPALIFLMRRWPVAPWLLIAASMSCVLGPEWLQRSLPGMLYFFLFGMLAAAHLGRVKGTAWCLPAALLLAWLPDFAGRPAAGIVAAGLILYCWSHDRAPVTRLLDNRVLQTVGIMCFSIYVWHEPTRFVLHGYHAFSPIQLANWAFISVAACLSYRLIERGTDLDWRLGILPVPRPAPTAASPAASPAATTAETRASAPRPAPRRAA